MKIQLDTNNKTIRLEESINLDELFELLNKILSGNMWKEYSLETSNSSDQQSPIIINEPYIPQPINPNPIYPYQKFWYTNDPTTYDATGEMNNIKIEYTTNSQNGVYNIEYDQQHQTVCPK